MALVKGTDQSWGKSTQSFKLQEGHFCIWEPNSYLLRRMDIRVVKMQRWQMNCWWCYRTADVFSYLRGLHFRKAYILSRSIYALV
jgi:hypothetical protein